MLWHYVKILQATASDFSLKLVVRRKKCPVNHLLRSNLFQHGHHPSCLSNPETQKLLSDAPGNQHLMSTNSYWAHFLALCGRGCVAPRRLHRAWQERGEGHPKSGLDWSDGMSTLHRIAPMVDNHQKPSNLTVEWSWTPWQKGGKEGAPYGSGKFSCFQDLEKDLVGWQSHGGDREGFVRG